MHYFIYARKSTDSEDRQVLSIDAQLNELREFTEKQGLKVAREFIESKSAKAPGREIFNEMLLALENGQADGIIAWQPDRLSRNSIDGGKIIYLIDQGIIKDLKFPTYIFDSSPHGKLNLNLAFGFSKLYIDNLSQNVKRGIREKLRRGEYPGPAPHGYINNLKTKTIEIDPKTFTLIQSLITKYSKSEITLPQIRKELYQAGVKTKGGHPLSYSSVKRLLQNSFYHGVFKINGEMYQGSHEPMISKITFDKVQKRLGASNRKVNWTKEVKHEKSFLFSEIGKCGECGYSIINDYHQKKSGKEYKYYRCSKKSKTCTCSQKAINENDLKPQITKLSSEIAITDEWYEFCQAQIQEWKDEELEESKEELENAQEILDANKNRLERLLDLKIDGEISTDEYRFKKNEIISLNSQLEGQIKEIQDKGNSWFEPLSEALKTSHQAHHARKEENFSSMFKILKKTGSNSILCDQKLSITFSRPFCFFREAILLTDRCSSPKNFKNKTNHQSQLSSGVGGGSVGGTPMQHRHIASHEPLRARGASAPKARELAPCEAECGCVVGWQGTRDSNPRRLGS